MDLFQGEGRIGFDYALGGIAIEKGVNDGIEGHSAADDVVAGFTLFDVVLGDGSSLGLV